MLQVWCARCGTLSTIPHDSTATWNQCKVCGYSQLIPDPQTDDPASPDRETYPLADLPITRPDRPRIAAEVTPKKARPRRQGRWADLLRGTVREPSRLQELSLVLIAVSVADLLMTFVLLRTHPHYYESNPIAQWFFVRWNMVGMVIFKFSLISFAIVTAEYIERQRPRWGQAVLLIGCVAAAYAFVTGLRLYLGHSGGPPIELD